MTSEITARIYRTEDGDLHHEYLIGGVAYSSIEQAEAQRRWE